MIKYFKSKGRAVWAAFLSGFVAPGVGQIFNRDYKRGVLLLVLSVGSLAWLSKVLTEQLTTLLPGSPQNWINDPIKFREALLTLMQKNPGVFLSFDLLFVLTWIFSVVDAYISARNFENTKPPDATPNPER